MKSRLVLLALGALTLAGCESAELSVDEGSGTAPRLPAPDSSMIPTVNIAPAIGWTEEAMPTPAQGLQVNAFARDLDHPRWLYVLPNGDVLVAETNSPPPQGGGGIVGWVMQRVMQRAGAAVPSANRITLLRDADGDGTAEVRSIFLENLNSPFGMALVDEDLYVANTDALMRFHYEEGDLQLDQAGEQVAALPAGPINQHWTKNVIAAPDGSRLYVTVGSNSNIGDSGMENETRRAAILEVDPDTGNVEIFASGLRNPNGLAWHPRSGDLWTTVNERDGLGSDLVPDYMTSVQRGGFYGWPYSYFGDTVDERVSPQRPDLVEQALVPDYALGPHTASLGLAFYEAGNAGCRSTDALPARYHNGAFVGQHGSWNRRPHSGYKVIFVPFEEGEATALPEDILTGFVTEGGDARGRPVGVVVDASDALLVADDVGNIIWRVVARTE